MILKNRTAPGELSDRQNEHGFSVDDRDLKATVGFQNFLSSTENRSVQLLDPPRLLEHIIEWSRETAVCNKIRLSISCCLQRLCVCVCVCQDGHVAASHLLNRELLANIKCSFVRHRTVMPPSIFNMVPTWLLGAKTQCSPCSAF